MTAVPIRAPRGSFSLAGGGGYLAARADQLLDLRVELERELLRLLDLRVELDRFKKCLPDRVVEGSISLLLRKPIPEIPLTTGVALRITD